MTPDTTARVGRYLLNSAVLTSPGSYTYRMVNSSFARAWLSRPYVSAIGYDTTADALRTLLDVERPAVQRYAVKMHNGEEALVFRLKLRATDPNIKRSVFDVDWVMKHSEIGLLTRIA